MVLFLKIYYFTCLVITLYHVGAAALNIMQVFLVDFGG